MSVNRYRKTIHYKEDTMTHQDVLALIEEGLENGRISRHLAAYIAAEVLGVGPHETEYDDRVRFDEEPGER
jgi:hypothetical protein